MEKQKLKVPEIAWKVIQESDVVLEILDARFVKETDAEISDRVDKPIIYVLNKADLVDEGKVKDSFSLKNYVFVSCKNRYGSRKLRGMIRKTVRDLGLKRKAVIGVIGYPNVGKSSLINFLTGKSSAKTGASAGFTKGLQKIRLSSDIVLLDSPGVIPEQKYSARKEAQARQAKIGARTNEKIRDPEYVVYELFEDYGESMKKHYNVEDDDFEDFLDALARKKRLLVKGGKADVDRVCRRIIDDWQKGVIKVG